MRAALIVLGWLFAGGVAQAAVVVHNFSGLVTLSTTAAFASPVGSAFTGQLVVDTSIPGQTVVHPDYDHGLYPALIKFSLQFAGFEVSATGPGSITVQDGKTAPYGDFFDVDATNNLGPATPSLGLPIAMTMTLSDPASTRFTSTQFPTALEVFPLSLVQVIYLAPSGIEVARGEITEFSSSAIPEPAIWAMMTAGFVVAGAALRRRRVSYMDLAVSEAP
jgi:hypothetical protein